MKKCLHAAQLPINLVVEDSEALQGSWKMLLRLRKYTL